MKSNLMSKLKAELFVHYFLILSSTTKEKTITQTRKTKPAKPPSKISRNSNSRSGKETKRRQEGQQRRKNKNGTVRE